MFFFFFFECGILVESSLRNLETISERQKNNTKCVSKTKERKGDMGHTNKEKNNKKKTNNLSQNHSNPKVGGGERGRKKKVKKQEGPHFQAAYSNSSATNLCWCKIRIFQRTDPFKINVPNPLIQFLTSGLNHSPTSQVGLISFSFLFSNSNNNNNNNNTMAAKQEIRHGHLSKFGRDRASLEDEIDRVNEENADRAEADELKKYKAKFLQIDADGSGDLDPFEILNFLNGVGMKDGGSAWTEPKVKEKVIKKFGDGKVLRYAGFLKMVLGDDMGRVLRLKMKFEKLAEDSAKPVSSTPKKLW